MRVLRERKLKLRDSSAFSFYGNVAGIIYQDFTVLGQNSWGKKYGRLNGLKGGGAKKMIWRENIDP